MYEVVVFPAPLLPAITYRFGINANYARLKKEEIVIWAYPVISSPIDLIFSSNNFSAEEKSEADFSLHLALT